MDYLFFNSVAQTKLVSIVVSYDIVCQWSVKLWERMEKYPRRLQLNTDGQLTVVFLVPKFHLAAHIASCQILFSFNLTRWVGRTDGEAPERGWSRFNNVSTQTVEMGPGSRRDTLDDHFGDWNWKKTVGLGNLYFSTTGLILLFRKENFCYAAYQQLSTRPQKWNGHSSSSVPH